MKKQENYAWGPELQNAFEILKSCLIAQPILSHPDYDQPFLLQNDASYSGMGVVLSQIKEDGLEHPIAYASRCLGLDEKNYGITELETLAVVEFVKYFRLYLFQQQVIVETDHSAVKSVLTKQNANSRIARWGIALSGYTLDIRQRKGSQNQNADTLSRFPNPNAKPVFDIDDSILSIGILTSSNATTHSASAELINIHTQKTDLKLASIIVALESGKQNNFTSSYKISNNMLLKNSYKHNWIPVIPEILKLTIITSHHDEKLAGHFGTNKTLSLTKKNTFWPRMSREIKLYCKTCEKCQRNKHSSHRIKAELMPIHVSGPFERIGVDCMGPLPMTEHGNQFVVVFIDYFTRYVEAYATQNIQTSTIANIFTTKIICRHGCPSILHSDRGSDLTSHLMKKVNTLLNCEQKFTMPYHPVANGEVERCNQNLATRIRMYVDQGNLDWDMHLLFAFFR